MTEKKLYPEVKSSVDFATIDKKILKYWQENKIFERSVEERQSQKNGSNNEFIFYDGPPFANGLPHYGHLLTGFVKDVFARYQTSKDKKVSRRFGWDCHGLPAEMGAEKELGISGQLAIKEFGIDKFNNHCRKSVMQFSSSWEEYVSRQARWVDFNNSYKTMDKNFMESVLWAFKSLYDKGLVYESMRVMPYSWACQTPLSNFETKLDNAYRERADKAVTVGFRLKDKPKSAPDGYSEYRVLAWTTTPWTLPSNLALAAGAELDYVFAHKEDQPDICYLIGKFALKTYAKEFGLDPKNLDETQFQSIKGSDLEDLEYEPLLPYFKDHQNGFKILLGDFVIEGDGTGIVHMAPGFGEDDQIVCAQHGIELVCPVDAGGKFTDEVSDFSGKQVFEANDGIIIKLKELGLWFKTEQYLHNYPHCWRTDTPLIYKAVPSWYVKVTEFKDRMVELNQQINWIPGNVKDGLFGKWLENARDWSISRNRFWGTPIPVWRSDDPKYPRIDVYGSIEELEKDFDVKVDDLHRPFIDSLTRPNPDDPSGKSMMRRVEDVFDCWFESGSMPYGQAHYPFENKEWFESHFPADFIVEYSAQTRGWFYTLMVLSTALFDRPPFLNCICHGVILDSTGQKLSKRLNNYADPLDTFDKYGSDALRTTMLSSNVVRGQELLIDKEGKLVFDSLRLFIKPIWNAYHFFCLYANVDGVEAQESYDSKDVLDRYILSKLAGAIESIKDSMDVFDTQSAYDAIGGFFEVLNNWYIRRSRSRFWQSSQDESKLSAYNTLYTCLINISKAGASLLPIIFEEIYLGLTQGGVKETLAKEDLSKNVDNKENQTASLHLELFPDLSNVITQDAELVRVMDQVLDICSSALSIRSQENIRVRQPLAQLEIITENSEEFKDYEALIQDEINVKSISYNSNLGEVADLKLSIKFPVLGKRLPAKMKDIIAASKQGNWEVNKTDDNKQKLIVAGEELLDEEYELTLAAKDSKASGSATLKGNAGLVVLDLNITKELEEEGIARDLIRIVQQARKDADYDVADRIKLVVESDAKEISQVMSNHAILIEEQTLSKVVAENGIDRNNEVYITEGSLQKIDVKVTICKE